MYKGKFGVWISLLIVCFIVQLGFDFVPKLFEEKEINISYSSTIDVNGSEVLNNARISNIKISLNKNNPDIIISDNSLNNENYTIYSDYFYSPLILYVRNTAITENEGFICVNADRADISPLKIDLFEILSAIENEKTWKDLGINQKVAKGNVVLTIPNERNPFYNSVVDLFYLTLNNGNTPTEEEKENLEDRVKFILSKCEKVVDIGQKIKEEYDNPSQNYKVFIGPEYLYVRGGHQMSRTNNNAFVPVYFLKTIVPTLNMYTKNNTQEEKTISPDEFVEHIEEKDGFIRTLGWRIDNANFSMDGISYSLIDFIPGYNN